MNSIKQAAEKLGVSEKTIRGLISAGKIEHHRIGVGRGTIRVSDDALDGYLLSTKVGVRVDPAERKRVLKHKLRHLKL